MKTTFSEH